MTGPTDRWIRRRTIGCAALSSLVAGRENWPIGRTAEGQRIADVAVSAGRSIRRGAIGWR
jgi:hypothetical protein